MPQDPMQPEDVRQVPDADAMDTGEENDTTMDYDDSTLMPTDGQSLQRQISAWLGGRWAVDARIECASEDCGRPEDREEHEEILRMVQDELLREHASIKGKQEEYERKAEEYGQVPDEGTREEKQKQDERESHKKVEDTMRMVVTKHHDENFARGVELRSAGEVATFVLEQRE